LASEEKRTMEMSDEAHEALGRLWVGTVEAGRSRMVSVDGTEPSTLWELRARGYVSSDEDGTRLTWEGVEQAEAIIRRRRIAEVFIRDALGLPCPEEGSSGPVSDLERLLRDPRIEEIICSRSGHPKECPHGRPIPPGRCCSATGLEVYVL